MTNRRLWFRMLPEPPRLRRAITPDLDPEIYGLNLRASRPNSRQGVSVPMPGDIKPDGWISPAERGAVDANDADSTSLVKPPPVFDRFGAQRTATRSRVTLPRLKFLETGGAGNV